MHHKYSSFSLQAGCIDFLCFSWRMQYAMSPNSVRELSSMSDEYEDLLLTLTVRTYTTCSGMPAAMSPKSVKPNTMRYHPNARKPLRER